MVSSPMDFGSIYSTKYVFPLMECQAVNRTRKELATSIPFVPLLRQLAYLAKSGPNYSLQDSQVGKTVDDFPSPAGSIAPSSILKASQQEKKLPY